MLQPGLLDAVLGDQAPPEADATTERILDAALAELLSFGLRRATVEDITRRAGVGRMTLHRRFPTKQALVAAVFLREIRTVLNEVSAIIDEHDELADKLVAGLAFGLRRAYEHPLLSRLLETDPEAMLPFFTVDAEALMIASTQFVTDQIRQAGGPAARRADHAGEAIIRSLHSILLTPAGRCDFRDDDELRAFLRALIPPLVGA